MIIFTTKLQSRNVPVIQLNVGESVISSVISVRNLSIHFDNFLTMEKQVSYIIKTCNYHLRNIGRIRGFISTDACKTVVNSLVTSRLDYGKSLLFKHKQSVTKIRKRDHITPILADLHWLPFEFRPKYEILVYTYRTIHRFAPE